MSYSTLELIGNGRKGRRKGSRNHTGSGALGVRIEEKNELKRRNERQRVKNISHQYQKLRKALGDPHPEKKLRKQQVLNGCIEYILELQKVLQECNTEQETPTSSPGTEDITNSDAEQSTEGSEVIKINT